MSDIDGSFASKRHDYGEDCSSCRMVSGFGMIGMGIYVLTAAKKQKTQLNRNFVYFISVGIISIGAARLLALPPFQRTLNKAEIQTESQ